VYDVIVCCLIKCRRTISFCLAAVVFNRSMICRFCISGISGKMLASIHGLIDENTNLICTYDFFLVGG